MALDGTKVTSNSVEFVEFKVNGQATNELTINDEDQNQTREVVVVV